MQTIICFESACLQSQYIVKNIQSRGQEKRGRNKVKLSLQGVSVIGYQKIEHCCSDRPSFHKLHQRAQVNNNLSSAKLLILDFSRPSYCLVFSVKTYIKVNLEVKITRIVYASFIIAVILNSRNYLKVIKRNIKKQNLRSTATVPRKLSFTYFVL